MGTLATGRELPNGGHVWLWEYFKTRQSSDGYYDLMETDHFEVEVVPLKSVTIRLTLEDARALSQALASVLAEAES